MISPMVLSCSDSEEPGVEPDVPVNPDVPLPPNPTPIRWVENEVDGGERGVGIKVTSNTEHNFVFECTPGSKVQSYRLDVYPLCRMYNYLFCSGYDFRLGIFRIGPVKFCIRITVGCNDEGGQNPADMKICYLKTPVQSVIGTPRVDIDVTTSYRAVGIQYLPNTDSKYFYQFCGDSEPIDAFINTYGKSMYIDFMRHWIQKAEDAQVPQEELYYTVDFGYTADAKRMITATSIGLDENKTPGEYVRLDFHLKEIGPNAELPECKLEISRIGASMVASSAFS